MSGICDNCQTNPPSWVEDPTRGDYICCDCGMVQDMKMLDLAYEHRIFSSDGSGGGAQSSRGRAQRVDSHLDTFAATIIGTNKKQKTHSRHAPPTLQSLQAAISGTTGSGAPLGVGLSDQHLEVYFSKIAQLASVLDLSQRVVGTAKDLICRYEKARGPQRRNLDVFSAALAVIDLACAHLQVGRPLSDLSADLKIAGAMESEETDVWTARKKIVKHLPDIDCTARPEDVIHNFCTSLGASQAVRKVALHIQARLQHLVEGKTVTTIAAGCIVLACDALGIETIDREDVSGVAQIAPTTLQNFYKIGKRNWGSIVPTAAEITQLTLN